MARLDRVKNLAHLHNFFVSHFKKLSKYFAQHSRASVNLSLSSTIFQAQNRLSMKILSQKLRTFLVKLGKSLSP